jgi:hypothetical protein
MCFLLKSGAKIKGSPETCKYFRTIFILPSCFNAYLAIIR